MKDPLQDWMSNKKLIDMYHIFQSNGVTIDQVDSLSTDTLNEMGLNIGQKKRFFSATGRDRSSNAAPSYDLANDATNDEAPMMPPTSQPTSPQPIIINNNNNNNNNNGGSDDTTLCFICNGTRKARKLWFVRTLVYVDDKKARDHVEEMSDPFWVNEKDGCRACQKTGRLPKKALQCPDCNGQGVSLLTIYKETNSSCCGPDKVELKDRNIKNCANCLGDGILTLN